MTHANICAAAALVLVESLQFCVYIATIFSFIPIHWSAVVPKGLEMERESFLYLVSLVAAMIIMATVFVFVRPRLERPTERRTWLQFLAVEFLWLGLMLFAFFKWITYRYPYPFYNILPYDNGQWVAPFLYAVLTLSILSKVFWPEISRFSNDVHPRWQAFQASRRQLRWGGVAFGILVFILLLPDTRDVLALSYAWDQFNHWDDFFLSRALLLGGLDYAQMVFVFFGCVFIFCVGFFYVIRRWLNSFWLAMVAVLLGIKITLFHYGMEPAAWLFPGSIMHWLPDVASWGGMNNVPMYDALRVRQFFSFFMGFALPVFYVFTLLLVPRKSAAFFITLYGLLIYTNYIAVPKLFSYGAVILPAIALLCFWLNEGVNRFLPRHRKAIFASLALLILGAVLTNRAFVIYPHAIKFYGQDFNKERGLFENSLDLSKDAALMNSLIRPSQPAAVIGSFELFLLRQAGHPSFFKHAPLLASSVMDSNTVRGLRIKTKRELLDTLRQLQQTPPQYIFVENKLFTLPEGFYQSPLSLAALLLFVRNHYTAVGQGRYFTAWQRK